MNKTKQGGYGFRSHRNQDEDDNAVIKLQSWENRIMVRSDQGELGKGLVKGLTIALVLSFAKFIVKINYI